MDWIKKALPFTWPLLNLRRKLGGLPRVFPLIFHHIETLEPFDRLVEDLGRHRPFLHPEDFEKVWSWRKVLTEDHLMVTFDDGFRSSKIACEKVLEPRGIGAAFFVCSDFIGMSLESAFRFTRTRLGESFEEPSLSWEDLSVLHKKGHIIGAHTATHPRLVELASDSERRREIVQSADELSRRLGCPVDWFAFPFGNVESIDVESLKIIRHRFRFCFSGVRGGVLPGVNAHLLGREAVDLQRSLAEQRFASLGGLDFLYKDKRRRMTALL